MVNSTKKPVTFCAQYEIVYFYLDHNNYYNNNVPTRKLNYLVNTYILTYFAREDFNLRSN